MTPQRRRENKKQLDQGESALVQQAVVDMLRTRTTRQVAKKLRMSQGQVWKVSTGFARPGVRLRDAVLRCCK
jgi:hypothetical protein